MANERAVAAENVTSVLELARLRRQSGLLSIESTNGGRVQEGEIYLQAGQPVYARIGQLVGQEALNRLLTWRNVHITFRAEEPAQLAGDHSTASGGASPLALSAPPPQTSRSMQASNSYAPADEFSERDRGNGGDTSRSTGALYPLGVEWLIPQKRSIDRDVLSLPLTRRQRFIYFLVDGRRSVSDLARCTGKTIQEIELILSELQAQGLVVV